MTPLRGNNLILKNILIHFRKFEFLFFHQFIILILDMENEEVYSGNHSVANQFSKSGGILMRSIFKGIKDLIVERVKKSPCFADLAAKVRGNRKRIIRWYISKNGFKVQFDVIYNRVWKNRYSDSKTDTRNFRVFSVIQYILLALSTGLIVGSSLFCIFTGDIRNILLVFIIVGIILYLVEFALLQVMLNMSGYHECEMNATKDTFSMLFPGYDRLCLNGKIALVDVFDVKYRNVLLAKINKYSWTLIGILFKVASAVYEILVGKLDWEKNSLGPLLVFIAIMIVLSNLADYLLSGRALDIGHYRQVTVRYRKWLIKTEKNVWVNIL